MRLYKLKGYPALHPVFSSVFPLLARMRYCVNNEKLMWISWILIDWCDWLHFLGKKIYFLIFLQAHLVYSSESAVPFLIRQTPTAEALHGLRVRRDGLTQLLKGAILITADLYFIQQLGQLPCYCVIYKEKETEGKLGI